MGHLRFGAILPYSARGHQGGGTAKATGFGDPLRPFGLQVTLAQLSLDTYFVLPAVPRPEVSIVRQIVILVLSWYLLIGQCHTPAPPCASGDLAGPGCC